MNKNLYEPLGRGPDGELVIFRVSPYEGDPELTAALVNVKPALEVYQTYGDQPLTKVAQYTAGGREILVTSATTPRELADAAKNGLTKQNADSSGFRKTLEIGDLEEASKGILERLRNL